ncbi:MAG: hypothetical protein E7158_03260 [Firmicutes bacterium]|nr:hypothetical protein [Bacillota bacterium]
MNVIISNKYQSLLAGLDIDVIKSINGEFEADEIVSNFANFFFNKMILDITAVKNYQDINTLQRLSLGLDMSKIIILLDDSDVVNSPMYLSQLVSMGIYNFTRNIDAVKFLIDNPNTYKDVASYHQLNMTADASTPAVESQHVSVNDMNRQGLRVIGIKNITNHAGSTTLTYLLKKHLEKAYKVVAVEVDNNDFMYLNDKTLKSVSAIDLPSFIATNSNNEVILVDLNDHGPISSCTEVIYLIEPGLIKLNKLIRKDHRVFEKLRDKKIILNRSILSEKDVADFEYESKSKVFYNMPYLDDKLDKSMEINVFLQKLGFNKLGSNSNEEKGSKLFGLFK